MKISLDKAQMLERRHLAGGLESVRVDCAIEYTDGVDVDKMLLADLRARYVEMLDHANPAYLLVENIEPAKTGNNHCGGIRVKLPDSCRRVFDIELDTWHRPVRIQPLSMYNAITSWQYNDYRAATELTPVAVFSPDGDILAWPGGKVVSLRGITDPGEDTYVLDESGLKFLLNPEDPT